MRLRTCARFVIAVLVLSAAACEPPTVPPRRVGSRTVAFAPPPAENHRGWAEPVTAPAASPSPTPQSRTTSGTETTADQDLADGRLDSAVLLPTDDRIDLQGPGQGVGEAAPVARDSAERERQQQTKGRRQEPLPAQPSAPVPVVAELARALEEREFESTGASAPPPVEQILRQEKARFQRCYDALVLRDPATLPGSLSVRLVLGPAGDVQQADVVSGTLQDPDFRDCIMTKLTALSFPRNDAALVFTYPFRFGAPGGEGSVE